MMVKKQRIKLVVIDDHPIVELGVKMAINKYKSANIDFCMGFGSGKSAISKIGEETVDVILLDMTLPDMSGIEILKKLLELNPGYKIGIYSSTSDKDEISRAFDHGAMGFISKTCSSEELIEFIRTLYKDEMYIRGDIAKMMVTRRLMSPSMDKFIQLTLREQEVYQLVLKGFKTKEIASTLHISDRTVEFHKQNIYHKFGVTDALNLTKIAMSAEDRGSHGFGNVRKTVVPLF